uniref:Cytochrome c oxidase subunit 6A2 n=1 Tax=Electrophorus electricus TaxID=8005 RepID=A0AAY5F693_ELEEL
MAASASARATQRVLAAAAHGSHEGGGTVKTWKMLSFLVALPGVAVCMVNAYLKQTSHPYVPTEFVPYPHLRIRTKLARMLSARSRIFLELSGLRRISSKGCSPPWVRKRTSLLLPPLMCWVRMATRAFHCPALSLLYASLPVTALTSAPVSPLLGLPGEGLDLVSWARHQDSDISREPGEVSLGLLLSFGCFFPSSVCVAMVSLKLLTHPPPFPFRCFKPNCNIHL